MTSVHWYYLAFETSPGWLHIFAGSVEQARGLIFEIIGCEPYRLQQENPLPAHPDADE